MKSNLKVVGVQRTELVLFEALLFYSEAKTCVEIGVAYGDATSCLCRAAKKNNGKVFGFDVWDRHGLKRQFKQFGSMEATVLRLKNEGYDNFVLTKVNTKSERPRFEAELDKLCPNGIDFVFIDGDHSYPGVKNDFEIVYPRLTTAGMIAFHDTLFVDGCREFALDLRTKYFDGTYDIIDFPMSKQSGNQPGMSLLAKRSYPKTDYAIRLVSGSLSTPAEIELRERNWFDSECKGKPPANVVATQQEDKIVLGFVGDIDRKKFDVIK